MAAIIEELLTHCQYKRTDVINQMCGEKYGIRPELDFYLWPSLLPPSDPGGNRIGRSIVGQGSTSAFTSVSDSHFS